MVSRLLKRNYRKWYNKIKRVRKFSSKRKKERAHVWWKVVKEDDITKTAEIKKFLNKWKWALV